MAASTEIRHAWTELEQAWFQVVRRRDDLGAWAQFLLHCDHLATTAERHALADVDDALRPVLQVLDVLPVPAGDAEARLYAAMADLAATLEQTALPTRQPAAQRRQGPPRIVMYARDESMVHEALLHVEHYGYSCRLHHEPRMAAAAAIATNAVAVVVELDGGIDAGAAHVIDTVRRHGILWCALARNPGYALRLQAVRAGARNVFAAPLSLDALAQVVDPVAFPSNEAPYKVLSLDDSRTALAAVRIALAPYPDVQLGILSQPHKVLEVLHYFRPDVLLLDLHIHGCSGLEVAQMVRQHKAFESIPIVYLTAETEKAAQMEAMHHGGDDLLVKPVPPRQLYNAVAQRARRYRGLRRLMEEDSLTGLYNHGKTKQLLLQAMQQADRQGLSLCYALIDIDHFKQVNDCYGHGVGDKVILTLARHLRRRVRRGDIVGRYGGEEFAIVLLDCQPAQAEALLNDIRASFQAIYHAYDAGLFCSTFSAGVAQYRGEAMAALMTEADTALYTAKRAGRNQVVRALPQQAPTAQALLEK